MVYASYQELARHPLVMDQIQGHVEEVNASIAEDEMLSGVSGGTDLLCCTKSWTRMMES